LTVLINHTVDEPFNTSPHLLQVPSPQDILDSRAKSFMNVEKDAGKGQGEPRNGAKQGEYET
jgi:hypothetical protein